MSRAINGNYIGRAAQTARRDLMNDLQESRQKFSQRFREAQNTLEFLLGDSFDAWWDSYAENMSRGDFLPIMENKVSEEMADYEAQLKYGKNWQADADKVHDLLHPVEEVKSQYECEMCVQGQLLVNGEWVDVNCSCCENKWWDCDNCKPVEEAYQAEKQHECEVCENGFIPTIKVGYSFVHTHKSCPCCNGNWQDCQNCKPEGTGNDTEDLLAGMRG